MGDSMRDFRQYCIENAFEDMFGDGFFDDVEKKIKARGKAVKKDRKTEPFVFELFRGFDADLDSLEKSGNSYVLSPKASEQGMMWFTHPYINAYNHIDYVTDRGQWLLRYPIQATKHYDNVTYEDGSIEPKSPDDVDDERTKNSSFNCFGTYCLELPKGWYWSYKMEKFIVTNNKLVVSPDMITPNNEKSNDQFRPQLFNKADLDDIKKGSE